MEIKKKTWPKHFQEVLEGKKNFDLRIADFDINKGDILVFEEFDPDTKEYTGRSIKKKVNFVTKINTNMYPPEDINKFGFLGIGLE